MTKIEIAAKFLLSQTINQPHQEGQYDNITLTAHDLGWNHALVYGIYQSDVLV